MAPCILITGATGRTGREVVSRLVAEGVKVRALVRDPATCGLPQEVEVMAGDLTRPETLDAGLNGADAVFLVWTASGEMVSRSVQQIAKRVRRIVFLSSPYQTDHPFFQGAQPNFVSALHAAIEQEIKAAARSWAFLRPGMFAANAVTWWAPQIRAGNVVRWPYLLAPTAPVDERDIAAAAVHALRDDQQSDYVLTGPESLTQREQIETIAEVLRRPLIAQEMTPGEARRELLAIIPSPAIVNMLLAAWAAALGQPALVTSTVTPARTFREWVTDHAGLFR